MIRANRLCDALTFKSLSVYTALLAQRLSPLTLLRYLVKEVLGSALAVSVVLVLIIVSARFVKYLAEAASGNMDATVLLSLMALRLPGYLELILPLGLLIGIILSYGRLYLDSEMIVMQACGMSHKRILSYTLVTALILALVVGLLTLFIGPSGAKATEELLLEARNRNELETIKPNRFHRLGGLDAISYADGQSEDKDALTSVFFAQNSVDSKDTNNTSYSVLVAKRAEVINEKGVKYFRISDGSRYEGIPGEMNYTITSFETFNQSIPSPDFSDIESKKLTDTLSFKQLLQRRDEPAVNAALQWRTSMPILVLIIAFIAVPLSKTKPRQGKYGKLLPAIIIYLLYLVALNTARSSMEQADEIGLISPLWMVHITVFALAALMNFWEPIQRTLIARSPKNSTSDMGRDPSLSN